MDQSTRRMNSLNGRSSPASASSSLAQHQPDSPIDLSQLSTRRCAAGIMDRSASESCLAGRPSSSSSPAGKRRRVQQPQTDSAVPSPLDYHHRSVSSAELAGYRTPLDSGRVPLGPPPPPAASELLGPRCMSESRLGPSNKKHKAGLTDRTTPVMDNNNSQLEFLLRRTASESILPLRWVVRRKRIKSFEILQMRVTVPLVTITSCPDARLVELITSQGHPNRRNFSFNDDNKDKKKKFQPFRHFMAESTLVEFMTTIYDRTRPASCRKGKRSTHDKMLMPLAGRAKAIRWLSKCSNVNNICSSSSITSNNFSCKRQPDRRAVQLSRAVRPAAAAARHLRPITWPLRGSTWASIRKWFSKSRLPNSSISNRSGFITIQRPVLLLPDRFVDGWSAKCNPV